ncbi:hypothetical protein IE53DRAFT_171171 [Violaceomyces palustris]|uniref:Uncharacterized protein n=1 Tax=Violaceomyces palustris TaxID=1673888 RepID=A0ACD0P612_9BASI|nr:hypothetical protein IE53DRAFT_171171 [Violaceomyces palustris]
MVISPLFRKKSIQSAKGSFHHLERIATNAAPKRSPSFSTPSTRHLPNLGSGIHTLRAHPYGSSIDQGVKTNSFPTCSFIRPMSSSTTTSSSPTTEHGKDPGEPAGRPSNRLSLAKSPYLLQHQHDLVDWNEFNDQTFQRARRENKLVFLSIGYSACHWCHVQQGECWSDPTVADKLNRDLVSVKVDREERPDVDASFMQFVMALTGSGGWPLTIFCTPDAKPIFGGTYFAKPDFLDLVEKISELWIQDRQSCIQSAEEIGKKLVQGVTNRALLDLPDLAIANKAAEFWLKRFDDQHGGFGQKPKFPTVSNTHHFLHRYVHSFRTGQLVQHGATPEVADKALHASLFTLLKISRGGITDHLGGGIARYSVDREWRVPHFEKMLYDQAQLLTSFVEAIQLARRSEDEELKSMVAELEATANGIVDYLGRDLSGDQGEFFSAEDADSYPYEGASEKTEGSFYVWSYDEIEEVLKADAEALRMVVEHYGIEKNGNIPPESDPHGDLEGKNMLHAKTSLLETARRLGLEGSDSDAERVLARAKAKLLERRNSRPRPHLDDKVITAWNGLTISALCKSAEVLSPDQARKAGSMALRANDFIQTNLYSERGGEATLRRSYRDGPGPWGFSSDYAFYIQALLDLFELTGDEVHLGKAMGLQRTMDEHFWDQENGGYFISRRPPRVGGGAGSIGADGGSMLSRQKEEQDGAEPSACSVAAWNLTRLNWLLGSHGERDRLEGEEERGRSPPGSQDYEKRRDMTIRSGGLVLSKAPHALGTLMSSLIASSSGGIQIVLVKGGDEETSSSMLREIRSRFLPHRSFVLIQQADDAERHQLVSKNNPAIPSILSSSPTSETRVHICQNLTCGIPIRDLPSLKKALGGQ